MDSPAELALKLERAYGILEELLTQQASVELDCYMAQTEMAEARSLILRTHEAKDLGANAEVREAHVSLLLTTQRQKVAACEQARAEARLQVEIARLQIEKLRAQLRLLEVAAALPRAA